MTDPIARPRCYHCGEDIDPGNTDRHIVPVDCEACPRCRAMPACYTCRNMYCSCEVHQL